MFFPLLILYLKLSLEAERCIISVFLIFLYYFLSLFFSLTDVCIYTCMHTSFKKVRERKVWISEEEREGGGRNKERKKQMFFSRLIKKKKSPYLAKDFSSRKSPVEVGVWVMAYLLFYPPQTVQRADRSEFNILVINKFSRLHKSIAPRGLLPLTSPRGSYLSPTCQASLLCGLFCLWMANRSACWSWSEQLNRLVEARPILRVNNMVVGACASLRHRPNEKSLAIFSDVVTCLSFALNSIII